MAKGLMSLMLCLFLALQLTAMPAAAQPRMNGQTSSSGPRKQLATIIFSGLAGAVLGLSTLSFYGRPQDRLSNIGVGLGLGIIAGTSYTTWQAATRPHEFYRMEEGPYGLQPKRTFPEYELAQRVQGRSSTQDVPLKMSYEWSF